MSIIIIIIIIKLGAFAGQKRMNCMFVAHVYHGHPYMVDIRNVCYLVLCWHNAILFKIRQKQLTLYKKTYFLRLHLVDSSEGL